MKANKGGSSHPELSDRIAARLGMQLDDAALGQFSNGEKSVEIRISRGINADDRVFCEESGRIYCPVGVGDVYRIVGRAHDRINDHVMELLILISACKMGSAKRITGAFLVN